MEWEEAGYTPNHEQATQSSNTNNSLSQAANSTVPNVGLFESNHNINQDQLVSSSSTRSRSSSFSPTNTNGLEVKPANSSQDCVSSLETVSRSKSDLKTAHDHERPVNVIPGVEHVFFEEELERMEAHKIPEGMDVVVLAVDNSKPSDMAFQFYVNNVNRPSYYLHLVHHSNYWGNYEPMDGGPSPQHCRELMEKENAKVKVIEDKYRGLMQANNIQGDFICLRGKDTWHDIIQHQEKVKAIMIVMGTRGQNSLRRTFMGSVSDSVVHHAHCPVLVCCHPKEHH